MDIQKRIQDISKYFISMNVAPSDDGAFITYVEVSFPDTWLLMGGTKEAFHVECAPNEEKNGYYFWSSESDACDRIFDAIDANIKVNKDAEARSALLMQKIKELQEIFADDNMDLKTLSTLEFKFSGQKKTKAKKEVKEEEKKVETPQEEITENTETVKASE